MWPSQATGRNVEGYRPETGQRDRVGKEIEDRIYNVTDLEIGHTPATSGLGHANLLLPAPVLLLGKRSAPFTGRRRHADDRGSPRSARLGCPRQSALRSSSSDPSVLGSWRSCAWVPTTRRCCRDCGELLEPCPDCDGWMETRMGRYGRFLGCSNWPECGYTRHLRQTSTEGPSLADVRSEG